MKKLITIILATLFVSNLFAQQIQIINKDTDNYQLTLYWVEDCKELTISYKANPNDFDYSEAIIIIRNTILEFAKENGFYHYKQMTKDEIFYNDYTRVIRTVFFPD